MPFLFGGGNQHHSQTTTGQRHPANAQLATLLQNAITGQLFHPPQTPISSPLAQASGAMQDLLPSVLGQAYGPNRGIAGLLGGGSTAPGGAPLPANLGSRVPTRDELGIPESGPVAPPGFFPPEQAVQENLRPVPVPKYRKREQRLEGRLARQTANDRPNKAANTQRKLDKLHNQPGYVPGST